MTIDELKINKLWSQLLHLNGDSQLSRLTLMKSLQNNDFISHAGKIFISIEDFGFYMYQHDILFLLCHRAKFIPIPYTSLSLNRRLKNLKRTYIHHQKTFISRISLTQTIINFRICLKYWKGKTFWLISGRPGVGLVLRNLNIKVPFNHILIVKNWWFFIFL